MTEERMTEERMPKFIESVFCVFQSIRAKADAKKNRRLYMITLLIFNYVNQLAKEYNIDLKNIQMQEPINLIPIFEYINYKNIEYYDFSKIDMADVDTNKKEDLERFVLTHIYYITQQA